MKMGNECILLVEDDDNDVIFLRRALSAAGINNPLEVVHDGQTALAYLRGEGKYSDRDHYPLPGLVFLDLNLPLTNGHEVLESLQADPDTAGLLVIVFTSSAEPRDVRRSYELGARSYLVKPSLPSRYVEQMRRVKDYWLMENEFAPLPKKEE